MIAGMIIEVGNQRVESHAPKQFARVPLRFLDGPTELLRQQDIRPAVSLFSRLFRTQQGESANHPRSRITVLSLLAIKALDEEYVFAGDRPDSACCNTDSAGLRQLEHGMLDARIVPPVVRTIELRDP